MAASVLKRCSQILGTSLIVSTACSGSYQSLKLPTSAEELSMDGESEAVKSKPIRADLMARCNSHAGVKIRGFQRRAERIETTSLRTVIAT